MNEASEHNVPNDDEAIAQHLDALRKEVSSRLPDAPYNDEIVVEPERDDYKRPVPGVFGPGVDYSPEDARNYHTLYIWLVVCGLAVLLAIGGYVAFALSSQATVPDLVGVDTATAVKRLNDAGLVVGDIVEQEVSGVSAGIVVDQKPRVDERVKKSSKVSLTVAKDSNQVTVPAVQGLSVVQAREALTSMRLIGQEVATYSDTVPVGSIVGQLPISDTMVAQSSTVCLLVSKGAYRSLVSVPRVIGLSKTEAQRVLQDKGLIPMVYEAATSYGALSEVAAQAPASKSAVAPGTVVQVLISTGNSTAQKMIPEVVGMTAENARLTLTKAGYIVEENQAIDSEVPIGTVVSQMPLSKDTLAVAGAKVGILVSRGPESSVIVPDVLGMTAEQAQKELRKYALTPVLVPSKALGTGKVSQQFPAGKLKYHIGMPVLLFVTDASK